MAAQSLKFPEAAGLGLENGGRGADSIGWPIALILFGMVMIGLSETRPWWAYCP
jgi:hypothetical protein